jgi:hypothetical protein
MKIITLNCPVQCVPLNNGEAPDGAKIVDNGGQEPGTFDPYAKQLVFTDQSTGEIIHYHMAGDLVKTLDKQLRMNNRAHADSLRESQEAAQAKAMLAGGPQMTPDQIRQMAAQQKTSQNGKG